MDEETRLKARELLLRSRIYRFAAMAFAVIGLAIFVYLYFNNVDGHFVDAAKKPSLFIMLLIPFLPAMVLSQMSRKAEKGLAKILGGGPEASDKKADKKAPEKKPAEKKPAEKKTPEKKAAKE